MGAAAAIIPPGAKGVFIGNLFLNVRPGPGGNGEGFQVVPDGAVAVFQKKILVLFKAKIGAVVARNLFGVKPLVQHSGSKKIGKFSIRVISCFQLLVKQGRKCLFTEAFCKTGVRVQQGCPAPLLNKILKRSYRKQKKQKKDQLFSGLSFHGISSLRYGKMWGAFFTLR